jgi:hypothetical protein
MNVFEDLVVELKEQNLLEETVIDRSIPKVNGKEKYVAKDDRLAEEPVDFAIERSSDTVSWSGLSSREGDVSGHKPGADTIRRQMSDKLQALQFIEYVVTAVESNSVRSSNEPFDDLKTKKALHTFEQACSDPQSNQYFEAESSLSSKLEDWEKSLTKRDLAISVEALRQYAETANPPLSPQTLFAFLRFYRSISFTKEARAKFDFVVTKLFSKFVDGDRRDLLCSRHEIIRHLNQRYSDWNGGRNHLADADDTNASLLVLSFDNFISEINNINTLNELRSSKLLERICELKESAGKFSLVPEVTAAAVECNIQLANKIIDIVSREMERSSGSAQLKYSGIDNKLLSEAAARTIKLDNRPSEVEGLAATPDKPAVQKTIARPVERSKSKTVTKVTNRQGRSNLFGVNRWLLLTTILVVIASIGVYVWSEYLAGDEPTTTGVRVVEFEKPELKKYIKVSKVSGNMLHAVVTTDYEKLDADGQHEYLQKILDAGAAMGYAKVYFLNEQAKPVGYASADRIETSKK